MAMSADTSTIPPPTTGNLLSLKDRVAIVTGSAGGIGKAIAIHLAHLGAKLVISDISNSPQADLVAAEINSRSSAAAAAPPRAITVRADISDPVQVKSLFDSAEEAFGSPIHILVNSAGIQDPKYPKIADTTLEDFDRTFRVNTRGAFLCAKEAANRLKQGGGGRIILVTSSKVAASSPGYGAYTGSKAAVEAMVKILSKELKGSGITANCVAPGPIATELFFAGKSEEMVQRVVELSPLNRLGETGDVAPVVGFLATDVAEWINGQIIRVNGGYI